MKHIKSFFSINESYQDGLDIIDAIENSPEGKDLKKIIRNLELKRTGRIWVEGGGSKTYIEKGDKGYGFESISQGKTFGSEFYPTIKECIRGLWSNIVSKKSIGLGIKKDVFRKWILDNIDPGQELDVDTIKKQFFLDSNQQIPDLSKIPDTNLFKFLEASFNAKYYKSTQRKGTYVLEMEIFKPFGSNVFGLDDPKDNWEKSSRIKKLEIQPTASGKSRLKDIGVSTGLLLSNSGDLEKDFTSMFIKWFEIFIRDIDHLYRYLNLTVRDSLKTLLKIILKSISDTDKNSNSFNDSELYKNIAKEIIKSPNSFTLIKQVDKFIPQIKSEILKVMGGNKYDTSLDLEDLGF